MRIASVAEDDSLGVKKHMELQKFIIRLSIERPDLAPKHPPAMRACTTTSWLMWCTPLTKFRIHTQ